MTEIKTLIQDIENKNPTLDGQIEAVIREAKDFRKKVYEWIGGDEYARAIINSLEKNIFVFSRTHSDFKQNQANYYTSVFSPIFRENIDVINDLYEAFATVFTRFVDQIEQKSIDDIFCIGKDLMLKPFLSLYKGLVLYTCLSDIIPTIKHQRFTRYKLSNKKRRKINKDFATYKKKIDKILDDFNILMNQNFQLTMYLATTHNKNATFDQYMVSISETNKTKKNLEDSYFLIKEPINVGIHKLGIKTYLRSLVYNIVLQYSLIIRIENGEIETQGEKDKLIEKFKKKICEQYKEYDILVSYMDPRIKDKSDRVPTKIQSFVKKIC